ncbi:MAG: 3-hydroxyacyl-ACP dehydratase FabZ family protein [bacterium]
MTSNHQQPNLPSLIDIEATFLPIELMRMVSRVTHLLDGAIIAECDLGPQHWVYPYHFPDDPIFPGSLIIEAAGQVVALWAWAEGQRGDPRLVRANAEFRAPVQAEDSKLLIEAKVRRKRHLNFAEVTVQTPRQEVATASLVLAVVEATNNNG